MEHIESAATVNKLSEVSFMSAHPTIDKSVVIDPERLAQDRIPGRDHFVFQCEVVDATARLNTFLVLQVSTLNKYAQLLIKAITELPKLRTVFLLNDQSGMDSFLDYLRAEHKSVRDRIFDVLHCPATVDQIGRMMNAWADGSEDLFIARAHIKDDELTLTSFGLNDFRVKFESMPSLSSIPAGERNKYHLLDDGRRIEWLDGTVSIDIDDVRYSTEPAFRFQENMRALNRYGLCGEAIRSLRSETPRALIEKRGGPSIKQQARIETDSQVPTRNMLVKLAKAHKMTMEGYVKQLLKESDRLEAGKLKAKLAKKPARKS